MNSNYRARHHQMSIEQEFLLIGQTELGAAFVNEFLPDGPANYPRDDQQACLHKIKAYLRQRSSWKVVDGHPIPIAYTEEESAKARHDLFAH